MILGAAQTLSAPGGVAGATLVIPNAPALIGLRLFTQGLILHVRSNAPARLVLTATLAETLRN